MTYCKVAVIVLMDSKVSHLILQRLQKSLISLMLFERLESLSFYRLKGGNGKIEVLI